MTSQPPPSASPPSSSRVIAALVERMEEALTPLRDGSVPGALHPAVVLGNVARAWEPLRLVLLRGRGEPVAASIAVQAAQPSLDHDKARRVALGRVMANLRTLGTERALLTEQAIRFSIGWADVSEDEDPDAAARSAYDIHTHLLDVAAVVSDIMSDSKATEDQRAVAGETWQIVRTLTTTETP